MLRNRRLTIAAAALASLALTLVPVAGASHQFTDVPNEHPFHTEIGIFKDTNITSGCTATEFCPQDFVKRQAMAAFIDRALGLVVRPSESVLRGVAGSRIAMIDDGTSLVRTNASGLELSHGGVRALRLEGSATSPNVVGGYFGNFVAAGAVGATIGGGGTLNSINRVTDSYGTVGGGYLNRAGNDAGGTDDRLYAAVGGGNANTASGGSSTVSGGNTNSASSQSATVGGGSSNTAEGGWSTVGGGLNNHVAGLNPTYATVAGGNSNTASATLAAVGGGELNTADGVGATIPGGSQNAASSSYSFAAGFRAKATQLGSFVWGDVSGFDVTSPAQNSFTARATGGATFISGINASTGAATAGVTLAAGGGSWGSLSDRAAKRDFRALDRQTLLRKLARLPITSWSYRSQPASIRHLGPTAQDFRGAFGLGEDSKHITGVDADGVALAAIQALYAQNRKLSREVTKLKRQNARLTALERQVAKLAERR